MLEVQTKFARRYEGNLLWVVLESKFLNSLAFALLLAQLLAGVQIQIEQNVAGLVLECLPSHRVRY